MTTPRGASLCVKIKKKSPLFIRLGDSIALSGRKIRSRTTFSGNKRAGEGKAEAKGKQNQQEIQEITVKKNGFLD